MQHQQKAQPPPGEWSSGQLEALELALAGRSVFITGGAGVGKSHVVREIIKRLRSQEKTIAITAPTGVAATHIGGATVHAWAGIGVPSERLDFQRAWADVVTGGSTTARERICATDVLVLDEVSMCSGELLDCLGLQVAEIRGELFGGGGEGTALASRRGPDRTVRAAAVGTRARGSKPAPRPCGRGATACS